MKRNQTVELILCALFAALTAILSQIAIPIGPVPINLATFSVLLAGALLGAKYGALSQLVYVLLGAVGVPVFSLFRGGVGVILGPTGGYIAGYVLAAWLVGIIADRAPRKLLYLVPAMLAGLAAYLLPGTAWFMLSTKSDLIKSLMTCVVPFLLGDALKIALAAVLAFRLKPILNKYTTSAQTTLEQKGT